MAELKNKKMSEKVVKDFPSLLSEVRNLCKAHGKATYWYRGVQNIDYTLVPSVLREYEVTSERNLFGRFQLLAPNFHDRCPHSSDIAGWLCLMQHYGLPTRLLDWSESLASAAFFASVFAKEDKDGAIWILDPNMLNHASEYKLNGLHVLGNVETNKILKTLITKEKAEGKYLAAVGKSVDLRMSAQKSGFTLHGDDDPLEDFPNAETYLGRIVIPREVKPLIEEELWVMGIKESTIFPNLHNLANELKNDWRLIAKKK